MEQLKEILQEFIRHSCAFISTQPTQLRPWTKILHHDNGSISYPTEMRPDFDNCFYQLVREIRNNKNIALDDVANALQKDPAFLRFFLVEKAQQTQWIKNFFLISLLQSYFTRAEKLHFDQQIFDSFFNDLQKDITSEDIEIIELSPLLNAKIESNQIIIDEGLILRQLSIGELENWLNSRTIFSSFPLNHLELTRLKCAVANVFHQKRYSPIGSNPDALKKTERLLTAIRLLTNAPTNIAFTTTRSSSLITPIWSDSWKPSTHQYSPLANITKLQESKLMELYKKLNTSQNLSRIKLAISRWNNATDRLSPADQLIDYWIALESMFVPDINQELKYRTALRIATFIGINAIERKTIYQKMKESYDLRSVIVHGSKELEEKHISSGLIDLTRSYLRQAILNALELSCSFEPENLETQLLERE